MTEAQLHEQVVAWLNLALPDDAVLNHSPHGIGKLGWKGKKMMATHGVMAGWPDIEIIWQTRPIFMELKVSTRNLTPAQRECHARLKKAGAVVHTCRSLVECQEFLAMLIPLKAKVT